MNILKSTISLCPECLAEIPATIYEANGAAMMDKVCPDHGKFTSMVERDAEFYKLVQRNNAPMFYSGLIIDVTYRCNIRCKWCFQHLSNVDVDTEKIYSQVRLMPKGHNIILSGGEPTVRQDLPEIVKTIVSMGYVCNVITNGYKLDWSLPCRWTLSYHPESEELFNQRVDEAIKLDKKFASIIYTDNNLDDFYSHIKFSMGIKNICEVFRMHMAAPVGGNLSDSTAGLFVSDMYNLLKTNGHDVQPYTSKTIFMPAIIDGIHFMLISWNTAQNVDIVENMAEPWYYGKGDKIDNLVTRIIRDN